MPPKVKKRPQKKSRRGLAQLAGLSEEEKRRRLIELLRKDVAEASDDDGVDEDWKMPTLDESGRTATAGPGLDLSLRSCNVEELSASTVDELIHSCRLVHAFDGSSWLPATAEPRCLAERLAKAIFEHHTHDAAFDAALSGAEWWAQVRQGGHKEEGIQFHWDTDESAVEQHGVNIHPHLSTVTYLTDCGAPTLVLECRNCRKAGDISSIYGPIQRGMLSSPRVGKHIVFDGQLLHGTVPRPGERGERVTFLVNVWLNHRPSHCPVLPEETARHLGKLSIGKVDVKLSAMKSPESISSGLQHDIFETRFARRELHFSTVQARLPKDVDTAILEWPEGAAKLFTGA